MVSLLSNRGHPMTKEQAAEKLASLLCAHGIYTSSGLLLELFSGHWSKLSMLAHAIHDDYRPQASAYENACNQSGK